MKIMLLGFLATLAFTVALPTPGPAARGQAAMVSRKVKPSPSPSPTPGPPFSTIITQLKQQTTVPIFLPQSLPSTTQNLYAGIIDASSSEYFVEIATVANCNLTHACTYGYIAGYSGASAPPLIGSVVSLSNGTQAYYSAAQCGGAGCSDNQLLFTIAGNVYAVGYKAGQMQETLDLANSLQAY
jgi:hypothetical protein